MTITWEAALALATIAAALIGGQVKLMQWMIRSEIGRAIDALNGKYVRSELCTERHSGCKAELIHRIRRLEPRPTGD
jgi:hypothetical protein